MPIIISRASAATVSFTTPQQIVISHTDDSIRIGDGVDLANVTAAGALQVDGSAVTQPVSLASSPLPTGAATAARQDTGNASLSSIDTKLTSPLTVTGPLTDTQLRLTPVPVSGTVSAAQSGTWNINNVSGTVSLPTGAATSSKQDTIISSLQALNSLVPSTYDYVSLSYTGDDLTGVVFKTGGSGGSTVSTLTLAYSSSILQTVTRT